MHSIAGYWIPFDAAKAVAATFCYSIRYALTPVFGPDFIETCIEPGSECFSRMTIDPRVVERCVLQCRHYKEATSLAASRTPVTASLSNSLRYPGSSSWHRSTGSSSSSSNNYYNHKDRSHRPSNLDLPNRGSGPPIFDSSNEGNYLPSPQSALSYTPCLAPRSTREPLPSPHEILSGNTFVPLGLGPPPNSPDISSGSDASPRTSLRHFNTTPAPTTHEQYSTMNVATPIPGKSWALPPAHQNRKATKAAWSLVQLHLADGTLNNSGSLKSSVCQKIRKRRASN
jgi:hypothetical protein